jgi:hypothetical protein
MLSSCKGQSPLQLQQTYSTEIIGTWKASDNSEYKLEFKPDGVVNTYNNNELIDTENYSVVISCKGNSITDGRIFLRIESEDGYVYCQTIEAVNKNNNNLLSFTTERGKLETYTKVN